MTMPFDRRPPPTRIPPVMTSEGAQGTVDDAQAPTLDDAILGGSETTVAPSTLPAPVQTPAPKAPKLEGLANDKILKTVGRGFTVGLPITQEARKAFAEAFAEDELAKYGMELISAGGGVGAVLDDLVEKSPFARMAVGVAALLGAGAMARFEYAQGIQQAQQAQQQQLVSANPNSDGSSSDSGFTAADLQAQNVNFGDPFAVGGDNEA